MPEQPEMVNLPVTIDFGRGKLQSVFSVPAGQTNLTELLPVLQLFSSGIAGHVSDAAAKHGKPVSCGPKCSACCSQLVPISPFEAEALANWVRSLPLERQQAISARFHGALLALQERGVLPRLTPEMFSLPIAQYKELDEFYFSAKVPCPFLIDDNCSIHPIRPIICREYMVVTPPEYCAEPGHRRAEVVVLPIKTSKALRTLGQGVEGDRQGWLPLVFLFHWMQAGVKPGESVANTGTEVLRLFLETLGEQRRHESAVEEQA